MNNNNQKYHSPSPREKGRDEAIIPAPMINLDGLEQAAPRFFRDDASNEYFFRDNNGVYWVLFFAPHFREFFLCKSENIDTKKNFTICTSDEVFAAFKKVMDETLLQLPAILRQLKDARIVLSGK